MRHVNELDVLVFELNGVLLKIALVLYGYLVGISV